MTRTGNLSRGGWRLAGLLALCASTGALSAAAGKASLNVYFQSTLKDPAYQKKVFQKVASTWRNPPAAAYPSVGKKTVVQAVLSRDGRVVSAFVSTESGSKRWDATALKTVEDAAPFEALPSSYTQKTLEAHFHFSVVP